MLSEKGTQNLYLVMEVVFILGKMWDISNPSEFGPQRILFCIVNSPHGRISGDRIKVFINNSITLVKSLDISIAFILV